MNVASRLVAFDMLRCWSKRGWSCCLGTLNFVLINSLRPKFENGRGQTKRKKGEEEKRTNPFSVRFQGSNLARTKNKNKKNNLIAFT